MVFRRSWMMFWMMILLASLPGLTGCSRKEKNDASDRLLMAARESRNETMTGLMMLSAGNISHQEGCSWDAGVIEREPTCRLEGLMIYTCTVCGKKKEVSIPRIPHELTVKRYGGGADGERTDGERTDGERTDGERTDGKKAGGLVSVCTRCGLVDESICPDGPALEHELKATVVRQGNCQEDTIVVYDCIRCGQRMGYDRYREAGLHDWIWQEASVWDENSFSFICKKLRACSRCHALLQGEIV